MKIVDDFLDKDMFLNIQNAVLYDEIPWFYNKGVTYSGQDNLKNYQLTHTLFVDQKITSQYFELFQPLLFRIQPLALIKIKLNLNLYCGEEIYEHNYHVDYSGPRDDIMTTGIFYLNTNNGYTIFEESKKKVLSVENRFLEFPTNLVHSGTTSTDTKNRIVLNLNYIK